MRTVSAILLLILLAGCADDELSWISIQNGTTTPIYALPYSADFTDGEWIQPGVADDFYSISCDCLDGFAYFSFYYDSLIIYLKDHEEDPIKFYKDGSAINYDPVLNPFTNPDVWEIRDFEKHVPGSSIESLQEKHIFEHYFSVSPENVDFLCDTVLNELNPAV